MRRGDDQHAARAKPLDFRGKLLQRARSEHDTARHPGVDERFHP